MRTEEDGGDDSGTIPPYFTFQWNYLFHISCERGAFFVIDRCCNVVQLKYVCVSCLVAFGACTLRVPVCAFP
jgi:hypothetical protein